MAKVICIVGLPGSGKTTLIEKMRADNPNLIAFDDISSREEVQEVITQLDKGNECIISDVYLTEPTFRKMAEIHFHNHSIEWVFFENDPEKCRANVRRRQDAGDIRDVEGSIRRFANSYVIPDGVKLLEIFGG